MIITQQVDQQEVQSVWTFVKAKFQDRNFFVMRSFLPRLQFELKLCGTDLPCHNCSQLLDLRRGQKHRVQANCHACFRAKAAYYSLLFRMRHIHQNSQWNGRTHELVKQSNRDHYFTTTKSVRLNLNRGACNELTKSLQFFIL